ncbi:unnamed protein product [Danaus chrysippus]|uniref:(African queen) hypothetical protein n=1 Tax=Danaus chrysippus TaxID=151541 RepID=A0A8J2VW37_9NEOP|nr:unnamed protein product [Danaus chrysippus]
MSSELVRQALAFVDPDESNIKSKKKKRNNSQGDLNTVNPFKNRSKKKQKIIKKSKEELAEENIKKLLSLSTPTEAANLDKIIKRAVKGKPLEEKTDIKVGQEKSILFPEESFGDFEKTYFCS